MFKGITNLAGLLKQAQQVSSRLQQVNDELKNRRAIGRAGGDMVEVEVNGLGQVLRVTLDPALVDRKDREMLEDLIPAATNQALAKAKELHADVLRGVAGGMELPGLEEAISKVTGGEVLDEAVNEHAAVYLHKVAPSYFVRVSSCIPWPSSLNRSPRLIDELAKLPGIGRKSAERIAYHILRVHKNEALALAERDPQREGERPLLPSVL